MSRNRGARGEEVACERMSESWMVERERKREFGGEQSEGDVGARTTGGSP